MANTRIFVLTLLLLPAGRLFAEGMALDISCTGTGFITGTSFNFSSGSGNGICPTIPGSFQNTGPVNWFNLLVTATFPVGFQEVGPATCEGDSAFANCVAEFDPSTRAYSAFFSGLDTSHPGILIGSCSDGCTNLFGFDLTDFPADLALTANANVTAVPEPSSLILLIFTGLVFVARRFNRLNSRLDRTRFNSASAGPH